MNEIDIRIALYNARMVLKGCNGTKGYSAYHMRESLYDGTIPHLTLDHMHDVEQELPDSQQDDYDDRLCAICADANGISHGSDAYPYQGIRATALQRAEAFLKTIGKWVEAPNAQP